MTAAAPLELADLPPYRHAGPCPRCAGRGPIRVHFDRDCAEARGEHFHRHCACGHEWIEGCRARQRDADRGGC